MKIYLTSSDNVHTLLNSLLNQLLGRYEIEKNQFGKPYVRGNAIYFNLSHSGNLGIIGLSETPVGVDIEVLNGRNHTILINHLNPAERDEISGEADFLKHFTAREAYVKNIGGSLFRLYKKISFEGGYIYLDGVKQDCKITTFVRENYVFSVCGDGEIEIINA